MPYLISEKDYIAHHGIKGQKWGIRRYQNPDGTLTEAGKAHYGKQIERAETKQFRANNNAYSSHKNYQMTHRNVVDTQLDIMENQLKKTAEYKEYSKALGNLERYEEKMLSDPYRYNANKFLADRKWTEHKGRLVEADKKYSRKIGEIYLNNADRIVSSKLRDLGQPDDNAFIDLYKNILEQRFPSLTEEQRIRMIH